MARNLRQIYVGPPARSRWDSSTFEYNMPIDWSRGVGADEDADDDRAAADMLHHKSETCVT